MDSLHLFQQTTAATTQAAHASLSWGAGSSLWRGGGSRKAGALLPPPPLPTTPTPAAAAAATAPAGPAAAAAPLDPASVGPRAGQPAGASTFKGHVFYGPGGAAARTLRARAGPLLWRTAAAVEPATATTAAPSTSSSSASSHRLPAAAAAPSSFEARASAAALGRRGDHVAPSGPGTALVAVTSDRHDGVPAFDRCLDQRWAGKASGESGAAPPQPPRRGLHLPPLAAALARQSWAPWRPLPPGWMRPVPHAAGGGKRVGASAAPAAAGRSTGGGMGWRPSRARPPSTSPSLLLGGGRGGGGVRSHLRAIAGALVGVQDEEGEGEGGGGGVGGGGGDGEPLGRPASAPGDGDGDGDGGGGDGDGVAPRAAGELRAAAAKGGAIGCLRGQGPSPRSLALPPRRVLRSAGATRGRPGAGGGRPVARPPSPPFAATAGGGGGRRARSASPFSGGGGEDCAGYGDDDGDGGDDCDGDAGGEFARPDPLLPWGGRSTFALSSSSLVFTGHGRRHRAGVLAAEQLGSHRPSPPTTSPSPPPLVPEDSIAAAATGLVSRRAAACPAREASPGSHASALAHRRARSELHNGPDGMAPALPPPPARGRFAGALTASRFRFTHEGVVVVVAAADRQAATASEAPPPPSPPPALDASASATAFASTVVVAREPASRGGGLVLSDGTVALPAMPFAARRRHGGWEHAGGRASLVVTEQGGFTLDALPPARGPMAGMTSYDAAFGGGGNGGGGGGGFGAN